MIFISIEVKAVVSWPTYLYILDMVAFKIMLSRRFFRFLSGCCPGDQKKYEFSNAGGPGKTRAHQ